MASATASSSAAVAALVQKASQQYLECRRKVTAKVDEVKAIDEQLQAAFAAMDMLRERGGVSAKSVGRLEVTLAGVEGPLPASAAAITVAIDPEYEADEDEFEEVEQVVEKRDVVTTDENGQVVEPGSVPMNEDGSTPLKLKKTTKITRTIIKKKVKKAKQPPAVRTIAWDAGEAAAEEEEKTDAVEEEAEKEAEEEAEKAEKTEEEAEEEAAAPKPLTFPATFVFDPVQSREAVVILTVASAAEEAAEPIKEIEFPISRLFGEGAVLDQWFALVDEEEEQEEAAVEATKVEEIVAEAAEVVVEDAEKVEEAQEAAAEVKEEVDEEAEKVDEEEKDVVPETAVEEEEEGESTEAAAEAAAEAETAEEVVEKEPVSRFHVKATFAMSEIEKLSVAAMALSKKKQEADSVLKELEREAASLRTKYERLNASQRTLSASSASKPRSGLLSSRFASQAAVQKSQYQKIRESVSAVFTPQRQQVLTSVVLFVSSVALFHYQGENLLM